MKQAVLLHGTGGSDTDYFWFEDTKGFLTSNGFEVWWPLLPNTENPNLLETVQFIESNLPSIDENTVVIAHSSACPLILHILESKDVKIAQVILVAGYYRPISDESTSMLPENGFDWELLKGKSSEYVFINSDNDPWKCTDEQAREAANSLDAPLIVNFGQGHMGSGTFNQPYREFDLLKRVIKT